MIELRFSFVLLAFALLSAFGEAKPNVLFIAIDDLNDWGIPGHHPELKTPNLDRLAKRGVSFTKAYCAAPACNPSRVAMMTGMHPTSSGIYYNQQDWRTSDRLKTIPTIPDHFQAAGYTTMGGGKIYHAASLNKKGFTGLLDAEPWDVFFPSKTQQMPIELLPSSVPLNGSKQFYKGFFDWAALEVVDEEMADGKVVDWACQALGEAHDTPLFLAAGIYRPHIPWYTPSKYFDLYPIEQIQLPEIQKDDLADIPEAGKHMSRQHWQQWMVDEGKWKQAVQGYLASASFADAMVGRLLDALEAGPLADNTVVVVWSDHGYHLGHKEHWEKFALWEQATHVPLIFSAPGLEGGKACHHPVSLLDVYPTLAALTGTGVQTHWDGVNLVPWLEEPEKPSDRAVVTTQGFENHAIRSAEFRYIRYQDGSEELYDHRNDTEEFTNLAGDSTYRSVIDEHMKWLPKTNAAVIPLHIPTHKHRAPKQQ